MINKPSSTKADAATIQELLAKEQGGVRYYDNARRALSLI